MNAGELSLLQRFALACPGKSTDHTGQSWELTMLTAIRTIMLQQPNIAHICRKNHLLLNGAINGFATTVLTICLHHKPLAHQWEGTVL